MDSAGSRQGLGPTRSTSSTSCLGRQQRRQRRQWKCVKAKGVMEWWWNGWYVVNVSYMWWTMLLCVSLCASLCDTGHTDISVIRGNDAGRVAPLLRYASQCRDRLPHEDVPRSCHVCHVRGRRCVLSYCNWSTTIQTIYNEASCVGSHVISHDPSKIQPDRKLESQALSRFLVK